MADKKTDWKSKYYELRSKHINAIDVSFRLGYQEGLKAAELQNMQMQLQQAQQAAMAAPPAGMPGEMPPGEEMPPEQAMQEEGAPPVEEGQPSEEPSELDSSVDELEQYVSKNEKVDFSKLMKSLHKSNTQPIASSSISSKYNKVEDILKKWEESDLKKEQLKK